MLQCDTGNEGPEGQFVPTPFLIHPASPAPSCLFQFAPCRDFCAQSWPSSWYNWNDHSNTNLIWSLLFFKIHAWFTSGLGQNCIPWHNLIACSFETSPLTSGMYCHGMRFRIFRNPIVILYCSWSILSSHPAHTTLYSEARGYVLLTFLPSALPSDWYIVRYSIHVWTNQCLCKFLAHIRNTSQQWQVKSVSWVLLPE